MAFKIVYTELASIHILHHYLLNNGSSHFEGMNTAGKEEVLKNYSIDSILTIEPTAKTSQLLKGRRIVFKNTPTGFSLYCEVDSSNTNHALADLTQAEVLSFKVSVKDHCFMNYSALSLKSSTDTIYYLNNYTKDSFLFPSLTKVAPLFDSALASEASGDSDPKTFAYYSGDIITDSSSAPTSMYEAVGGTNDNVTGSPDDWQEDIPAVAYDNTATYNAGDMVRYTNSGTTSIYEALNETTGNLPTTSHWTKLVDLPLHYLTVNDRIDTVNRVYDYTFATAGINARIVVQDILGNTVSNESVTSSDNVLTFQTDMRALPEGYYKITITNTDTSTVLLSKAFYLIQEVQSLHNTFAIIEILLGSGHGNYSLVDSNNQITPRKFEIRIKNRSTHWRYLNKSGVVLHTSNFNPLTKHGFISEQLSGEDLPNPDVYMIKPEAEHYYSELYLNTTN